MVLCIVTYFLVHKSDSGKSKSKPIFIDEEIVNQQTTT